MVHDVERRDESGNDNSSTVTLMEIYSHEAALDAGRFASYSDAAQEHVVSLPFPQQEAATQQKIEWIADHTNLAWNIDVVADRDAQEKNIVVYSFADVGTAVMFKLTFAGEQTA